MLVETISMLCIQLFWEHPLSLCNYNLFKINKKWKFLWTEEKNVKKKNKQKPKQKWNEKITLITLLNYRLKVVVINYSSIISFCTSACLSMFNIMMGKAIKHNDMTLGLRSCNQEIFFFFTAHIVDFPCK